MKVKNIKKYLILIVIAIITASIFIGCGNLNNNANESSENTEQSDETLPIATINIKGYGVIVAELYPKIAPNTVNNFIDLANKGFYNNLTFHRIIKDFMIQGGDPSGDGTGGPGYTIKGEFTVNGFKNKLKHTTGVLSMARTQKANTAGSQFFIMTKDAPHLDNNYAAFGKVISGLYVLEKIGNVETDETDKPLKDVVIESITIDTKGIEYKEPNKIT